MRDIDTSLKIYELSLIWREAEYNFAFWDNLPPSFDWDEEYKKALARVTATDNIFDYYRELMRFISLLRDGHTGVWLPDFPEASAKIPIMLSYIDGRFVVTNVKAEYAERIRQYDVVKRIDGVPISEYMEENIYPYVWYEQKESAAGMAINLLRNGPAGSRTIYTLEGDDGEYDVTFTRKKGAVNWVCGGISLSPSEHFETKAESATHMIEFTEDNIAVIRIPSMEYNALPEEIWNNFSLLREARGYIIDVRGNGGGNSWNSNLTAALFIDKDEFVTGACEYRAHIAPYKAWGMGSYSFGETPAVMSMPLEEYTEKYGGDDVDGADIWRMCRRVYREEKTWTCDTSGMNKPGVLRGPVAILTDSGTGSAAEDFVGIMRANTDAAVVGRSTFGSTGQPLFCHLESGGGFRICTIKSYLPGKNGEKLEFINRGIIPDTEVPLTLDDVKSGVDRTMDEALRVIREKLR